MRKHYLRSLAGIILLTVALAAMTAADPAAVLVRFQGDVRVQRAGTSAGAPAALGTQLAPGDMVLVGGGARAVLLHRTGKVETITRTTRVAQPTATATAQSTMFSQTVKTLAQVATTDAREKPNRTGMIRPIPGWTEPLAPRNDIVLLSRRPTFAWVGIPGAEGYTLLLGREGQKPQRFQLGKDTTWTLPAKHPLLDPGARYVWTIGDSRDGRVAPLQRFRVASNAQRVAVQKRVNELRKLGLAPDGEGLFLTALIYRDAGLWYELDAVLNRLGAADNRSGSLYHQLRGETYDAIGRLDAAAREFAQVAQNHP